MQLFPPIFSGNLRLFPSTPGAKVDLHFFRVVLSYRTTKNRRCAISSGDLTEQVRMRVVNGLLSGEYMPGDRLPAERDFARLSGCSRITVRRAFARLETAGIITRSPAHGTRISSCFSGNTAPIESVGILATLRETFAVEFIDTLTRLMNERGILAVLAAQEPQSALQAGSAVRLFSKGVRNLIVWGLDRRLDFSLFEKLRVLGVNLVFFDRVEPGPFADFVGLDNRNAVEQLFCYTLARKKPRRILFANRAGLAVDALDQRRDRCRELCRQHGIDFAEALLPRRISPEQAREAVRNLDNETALFCANDEIALPLKMASPELDCCSIDGTGEAAASGIVSIRQPMAAMAAAALDALERQRKLGARWKAGKTLFNGTLIEPDSSTGKVLCP